MHRILLAAAAVATVAGTAIAAAPPAGEWEIGPVIRGKNYSYRMPLRPDDTRAGPSFDIPGPAEANGHVHYLTVPTGPLRGAKRIVLTYRLEAAPGTRFVPRENPEQPAIVSLYLQRAGDSWTMRHPDWRWYAPNEKVQALSIGTHTITVGLDENWVAMATGDARSNPRGFSAALADTARVGFVFGSYVGGRGHGIYATRPARFTILDFRVE